MRLKPLFAYCAEYVAPNDTILGDAITEHSTRHCDQYRAERIREGREPVPPYAWSALKSLYFERCSKADMIIQFVKRQGNTKLFVTDADMQNPVLQPILIRAILQLPSDMRADYDPYAPSTEETWGML